MSIPARRDWGNRVAVANNQDATCGHLITCSFVGTSMGFMFENLQVYQKAVDLADQVLIATSEFPKCSPA